MVKILRMHQFLIILLSPILLSCEYCWIFLIEMQIQYTDTIKYRYNSDFSDIPLVPWSWLWWEYLYHGKLQMPNQVLTYVFFCWLSRSGVGKLWPVEWPTVFENKVLLEHRHAHSFLNYLWLLSYYHDRDERPQKPKIFTPWPFKNVCQPMV